MKQIWHNITNYYHTKDQQLLINRPWLWETKPHLAMVIGISLSLLALIISLLFPDQIVFREVYKGMHFNPTIPLCMGIVSLVGFGFWVSKHYYLIGLQGKLQISSRRYQLQFLSYFISCFLFSLPTLILLAIGFSHYFIVNFEGGWLWMWGDMVPSTTYVIILSFIFVLASIIQTLKSLPQLQLLKVISAFAILFTVEVLLWAINPLLGALLIILIPLTIALDAMKNELPARIQSDLKYQLIFMLLLQILAPIGSVAVAHFPALFSLLIVDQDYITCIAWPIGIAFYIYKFLPYFHEFYLKYRQLPVQ